MNWLRRLFTRKEHEHAWVLHNDGEVTWSPIIRLGDITIAKALYTWRVVGGEGSYLKRILQENKSAERPMA